MWRICERRGLRKEDLVDAGKSHLAGRALALRGRPLPIAKNYVVFARSSAIILKKARPCSLSPEELLAGNLEEVLPCTPDSDTYL
jgi:hypothetical protein